MHALINSGMHLELFKLIVVFSPLCVKEIHGTSYFHEKSIGKPQD